MADTEIRRTTGSTPTNAKKFTLSFWLKKSKNGQSSERGILGWRENSNSGNNNLQVQFDSNDKLQVGFYSNNGNDTHIDCITNRQFKDNNSFYHFVIAVDSTQGTSSNRVKIYVNGVQETSFGTATYPAVDRTFFSNDVQINVGKSRTTSDTDRYFNGVISHLHFTDGYTYAASDFGFTDATTGEWRINTSPSVTYGNNGFWWLKDSIATTDHSPNSNTFSVGNGTLTKTEDNPSNVFATWNPFSTKQSFNTTFTNGNNRFRHSQANEHNSCRSTLGFNSGKWYAEFKVVSDVSNSSMQIGISSLNTTNTPNTSVSGLEGSSYEDSGTVYRSGYSNITSLTTFAQNDIIGVACDFDNKMIYWYKNGTLLNSTGYAFSSNTGIANNDFYGFACSGYQTSGDDVVVDANFGNGYFATTAVSSAGTNASGIGIFEYDVPTGYTALSTKGLNE